MGGEQNDTNQESKYKQRRSLSEMLTSLNYINADSEGLLGYNVNHLV